MCGRFTLIKSAEELEKQFEIDINKEAHQVSYNIAPSQKTLVVTNENPDKGSFFQWGLVPFWAKDPKIGYKMINARSETVFEKPAFKNAIQKRRCIIPSSGFYEWKRKGKEKIPFFISSKTHEVMAFAGLWESWKSKDNNRLHTFTILTTEANEKLSPLHDRMPVLFTEKKEWQQWLQADPLKDTLSSYFRSYPSDDMKLHEVSQAVNSPKNNRKELIEPQENFGTLF